VQASVVLLDVLYELSKKCLSAIGAAMLLDLAYVEHL
jgi:hypothetical protein